MLLIKSRKRQILILTAFLFLITFAAFSPCLKGDFLNWDDDPHLVRNPHIHEFSLKNTLNIFRSTVISTYIPLTVLSFNIEHALFGLNPLIYHLNNLLLHIAVSILIFIFFTKLSFPISNSFIAALIFALHPIHVESVAWITERKDVLYSFFYLLSLIYYVDYLNTNKKQPYLISLLFCLLSILSKAMALSLPLILLLTDWLKNRPRQKNMIYDKCPYIFIIVPIAWITYSQNTHILKSADSLFESFLILIWTFSFYILKFLFPLNLSLVYLLPKPISVLNPSYFFPIFLFLAVPLLLFFFRKNRVFIFAWAFYICSIFFLLRTSDLSELDIVADRFMYLPSLGFCLLLGDCFYKLFNKRNPAFKTFSIFIVMSLIGSLTFKTIKQCYVWENTISLWSNVIKHTPDQFEAYNYRGFAYSELNRLEPALRDLNQSISLNPGFYKAYNNRGTLYLKTRQLPLAIKDFNKAADLHPAYAKAHYNLGRVFFDSKDYLRALDKFNTVKNLEADFPKIELAIGDCYFMLSDYSQAIYHYTLAISGNHREAAAYNNRALAYNSLKKFDLAIIDLDTAITLRPSFYRAYNNRGFAYLQKNNLISALNDFNKALEISPRFANAYYNRSLTYLEMKNEKMALEDALMASKFRSIQAEDLLIKILNSGKEKN